MVREVIKSKFSQTLYVDTLCLLFAYLTPIFCYEYFAFYRIWQSRKTFRTLQMKRSGVERRCNQVLVRVEITRFLRTLGRRGLQCLGIAQGWTASSAAFRQYGSKDTLLLSNNSWSNQRKTRRRQLRAVRLNQTKRAGRSLRNILVSCARRLPKQDAHCVLLVVVVYWV